MEVPITLGKRRKRRGSIAGTNESSGVNANLPGFAGDDFDDCMALFIRDRQSAGRSADTIKFYREQLTYVRNALEDAQVPTRLNRITYDVILTHIIEYNLNVRKVRYTTLATRLRALRALMNWAETHGIVRDNPMREITIK